jgi:NAD(P)-dependent dehydrogenase (short-subunit alcohol dehydrogenase family)
VVVDHALAGFGRIDALLNIAGAVPQIDLLEMTDAQWESGLALKLHGARRLTIAAWPALKEARGSVVLMSGNSALFPKAPYAAVGTINAAIVALAKAFADRGIADGIQVNSVLPGPVMTGRCRSYLAHCTTPQYDRGGSDLEIPAGSRHRPLSRAGGDRRADGVSSCRRAPAG